MNYNRIQENSQPASLKPGRVTIVLMGFLVCLIFIVGLSGALYLFIIHIKLINRKAILISGFFALALFVLLGIVIFKASKAPDTWCSNIQNSISYPPAEMKTSMNYFERGNYNYDTGRCKEAIADYTKSIELNSKYPQAFNNRAYTYMRMGDYKNALIDLDNALTLNPNYINALMNRGDIHNYYFEIDRSKAIADYEKIISIAGTHGTSVCGHLFLARHNGWNLGTILNFPFEVLNCQRVFQEK